MKTKMNICTDFIFDRFPILKLWNEHMAEYYAPKNFNIWYFLVLLRYSF